MRTITETIVHATATRANWMDGYPTGAKVAEVKRWHVQDNGWSDIGYHFLIDRDGTVATGRPIERTGAHVKGHNTGTVGVSLFGGHGSAETDAFSEHFTEAQDAALRELLADLDATYGPGLKISGHNEYAAKACPGFNVAKWLAGALPPVDADPATDPDYTAAAKLRWRLAEIRDAADRALAGE